MARLVLRLCASPLYLLLGIGCDGQTLSERLNLPSQCLGECYGGLEGGVAARRSSEISSVGHVIG